MREETRSSRPHISVVVCTYNRAALLPDALQSLLKLDVPFEWLWDILVVDNNSSDTTAQVVAKMMRGDDRLRYVLEPQAGVASARNCGIAKSTGEWLAFFDDDEIADRAWLRELVDFAWAKNARVVGGGIHLSLPEGTPQMPLQVHRLFGTALFDDSSPERFFVGGGNTLFHRSVFNQIGVYDTALREGGEDMDLARRIRKAGIVMGHNPRAIVHHRIAASRLETPALLAASRRVGWGFARRDQRAYGTLGVVPLCCARLGLLGAKSAIRFLSAASGDRQSVLAQGIDAARTYGYAAATASFVLPAGIKSRLNLGEPSFRDELGRTASPANTGKA